MATLSRFGFIRCPAFNASLVFYLSRSLRIFKKKRKLPRLRSDYHHLQQFLYIATAIFLLILLFRPNNTITVQHETESPNFVFQQDKLKRVRLEKELLAEQTLQIEKAKKEAKRLAYVSYINKNYYISRRAAILMVVYAEEAAKKFDLPTSLILAVIAKESRFNPYAGSVADAEGLMQVIPRWHPEKMKQIGGAQNIIQPDGNIYSGSKALREKIDQCNGNIVCALQTYNGNIEDETTRYANKVLTEQNAIKQWTKTKEKHRS